MVWKFINGYYHITLSATGKRREFSDLSAGMRWAFTEKLATQVANEMGNQS